ncbi:putative endoglucanase [Rhodovastum atsumiense]|uniref:cellulase n=1 Tax=Rhodovastum atsumiense TaxID=504468 RepID=A0A5M6J391_9PROT|nr:glycosyl hydrolase family 8 [Rhodovastum atsumiense]KAA5614699.1 glycosyl hydrolase family 5 [Rhodovastum atsumiense]CAH2599767.1 putative endoglucanase [Rhodovastum atsumiense]
MQQTEVLPDTRRVPGPGRRRVLTRAVASLVAPVILPCRSQAAEADDLAEWNRFRSRFLSRDGRILDTGNDGVSHSEGQGWGLFLAATLGDRGAFDRILGWTTRALRRRDDALHAWRYVPQADVKVADPNNATDGDLFIAAALARAARRWGNPAHAEAATAIARDVLRLLVSEVDGRSVLLPGLSGFETPASVVVNPSYYAFPALAELALLVPSPRWAQLRRDAVALLQAGRFGRWRLPPDWLQVPRTAETGLVPAPGWPARFSFDAIRVPLYLAWGGVEAPELMASFGAYWSSFPAGAPAWIDLTNDATAPYGANPGMAAIAQLVMTTDRTPDGAAALPRIAATQDYYGAALVMLSRIAWRESAT